MESTERDSRAPGDRPDDVPDHGFSLIEVVMTVTILSIVILPIFSAVLGNLKASTTLRNAAQVQTVLQNAADRVNRAPKQCTYSVYAQAATQSEGWSADRASVQEWHYEPAASPTIPGNWIPGACTGSTPTELLVQKVVITVSSPDDRTRRTMEVVKSDV